MGQHHPMNGPELLCWGASLLWLHPSSKSDFRSWCLKRKPSKASCSSLFLTTDLQGANENLRPATFVNSGGFSLSVAEAPWAALQATRSRAPASVVLPGSMRTLG